MEKLENDVINKLEKVSSINKNKILILTVSNDSSLIKIFEDSKKLNETKLLFLN